MTQEQKDLLLKDLCARLPYRVKCLYTKIGIFSIIGMDLEKYSYILITNNNGFRICENEFKNIKPYLFPMSSMTEEQKVEFEKMSELDCEYITTQIKNDSPNWTSGLNRVNWLIKNHFDIYGLIPMGLAIDATGLNIY